MKKKLLALGLAATMVVSMTACGGNDSPATVTATPTPGTAATVTATPTPAPTATPVPTEVPKPVASLDFEDGSMSFVQLYMGAGNADAATLEVADVLGTKALKIANSTASSVAYVALDVSALLGDKVSDVASVEISFYGEDLNGNFNASSGKIITWTGEGAATVDENTTWSVFNAKQGFRTVTYTLPEGSKFTADNNIIMFTFASNAAYIESKSNAVMYIDDVRFVDAAGNTIKADSKVAFVGPESFAPSGTDMTNLYLVKNAVNFEGFAKSAGAWSQDGLEMPQEILDALVPGSVVEISYTSEDGDIWVVMPNAAAGWIRVAQGSAYKNDSRNTAQVTYEQIEALCGTDKSTWGPVMQCESSSAWEVYSVKVGTKANNFVVTNGVELEGFAKSAGAWSQDGVEMSQAVLDALVPGSVVEISYASEDGALWIVMPDSAAGWMRVSQGSALCVDGKCYITYEEIAALCGEDKTTWGARMQCESSSAWEVYSVKVGTPTALPAANKAVAFEGFTKSAGAWSQDGLEMTAEVLEALVPGSAVKITYSSEDGALWVVMPDAAAGWSRCAQGTAACVNGVCYVTYEQIEAVCGSDKSTWGARMQCESSSAWEVYKVEIVSEQ